MQSWQKISIFRQRVRMVWPRTRKRILTAAASGHGIASGPIPKSGYSSRGLQIKAKPVYNAAQFASQNCKPTARERGFAMKKRNAIRIFLAAAAAAFLFAGQTQGGGQSAPVAPRKLQAPRSVRLYVFDCGVLHNSDM